MFRTAQCSSSGDRLYEYIIWHVLVYVGDCLVCQSGGNSLLTGIRSSHLHRLIHTRWCMCDHVSCVKMTRGTNLIQQLWFIIINNSTCFRVQVVCCCIWCSALRVVAVVLRSRCVVLCTLCKFVSDWHGHVRGWEGSMARSRGFGSPGLCSGMSFPSLWRECI